MKRGEIGTDAAGKPLVLPEDAVTQGFAILARRRSGKSNLAGVMEETFCERGDPWICIDPVGAHWGIKYLDNNGRPGKASGNNVLLVGGDYGDVPLQDHAGAELAEIIVDTDISCVIDLTSASLNGRQRFVADFANTLFRINKTPRHVILEEADEFVPQQLVWDNQKLVRGALERLIKGGGGRGIGFTLITQRPASIAKNVLTQIDNLFVLRMSGPQDLKAVEAWFEHNIGDKAKLKEVLGELAAFRPGDAWLLSPEWLEALTRLRVRERVTYHAGRTPKRGEKPIAPAKVNLPVVIERFTKAAEKRNAAIVEEKELKIQVADLKKELAAAKRDPQAPPPPDLVISMEQLRAERDAAIAERDAQAGAIKGALEKVEGALDKMGEKIQETLEVATGAIGEARVSLNGHTDFPSKSYKSNVLPERKAVPTYTAHVAPDAPAEVHRALADVAAAGARKLEAKQLEDGDELPAGSMKMLLELAARFPKSWTQKQLGSLTGYPYTKSTYRTYRSRLTSRGLVEVNGNEIVISAAGLALVGDDVPDAPKDHASVMEMWRKKLPAGSYAMLAAVVAADADGITEEQMAERSGYDRETSTYRTYRSRLTSNGLATIAGGVVRATDVLFPS